MADIMLEKPLAGAQNIVDSAAGSRITLGFPIADATLERSGNDLIFHFEDGSSVVLRDFYTAYTQDTMPDFVIDGAPVSGGEFFAALNDQDLMPAAGPAANAANAAGGRYHEFGDDPLQTGVDRLDGLDLSSNRAFYPERDPFGGARSGDSTVPGETDDPLAPADPDTPDVPEPLTPNTPPSISVSGATGVIESGVHPGGNVAYAGVPEMPGAVTASDADGDSLHFGFLDADGNQVNEIVTDYGTVVMRPDGTYTYTLDNADPDTNGLALGETREETFTVFVDDGNGGVTTQEITVTIVGANDQPTLELSASALDVIESGVGRDGADNIITSNIPSEENASYAGRLTSGAGQAQGADVDHGAVLTYGAVSGVAGDPLDSFFTATDSTQGASSVTAGGTYGDLTLNNDGSYSYTLHSENDANIDSLHEGETVADTFTVYVKDEHGAWSKQELAVTITGTNDRPEISAVDSLVLKETGVQDGGNMPTTPDGAVAPGGDGHRLTATGHVAADDVDNDDDAGTLHYSFDNGQTSLSTGLGAVTIDQNGNYAYTLDDGAADSLAQGETRTESFTVMVTDSHGATREAVVNVTVYGTNDRPVLTISDSSRNMIEDKDVSVEGTFTVRDVDTDGSFKQQTGGMANQRYSISGGTNISGDTTLGTGTPSPDEGGPASFTTLYGTLTVNPEGTWRYDLNNDSKPLHALKEGKTRTENFEVMVTDVHGATHTQTITITITGTNDAPVLTPVIEHVKDTGVFGEDSVSPNTPTTPTSAPGADGHIKSEEHRLGFDGQLEGYDAESSPLTYGVKGIAKGDTLTLTNPDDPSRTTTVGVTNVTTTEDGTTTIVTGAGAFILNTDGRYTFTLDSAEGGFVDSIPQGEKWNLTFNLTASDNDGGIGDSTLTICIEGANEAPTFTELNYKDYTGQAKDKAAAEQWKVTAAEHGRWRGDQGDSNRETDHSDVLTGRFSGADRDTGESDHLTFGAEFKSGSISGGNKTALGELGSLMLTSSEERTYDKPVRLADYADKGTADHTELPAGTYKIFHFEVGDFYLNVNSGDYYFNVNDDSELVNKMNLGDTHSLTFNLTVTDEHGAFDNHEFTIDIEGRNDRPVLTVERGISATDDGQSATGKLSDLTNVEDADLGDSHTFFIVKDPTAGGKNAARDYAGTTANDTANKLASYDPVNELHGKYGTLSINEDGSYTYTLDDAGKGYDAVKALPEGDTLTEDFHIAVQDKHGAFDIKDITITVNGINDAPVISGVENLTLKETGVQDGGNTPTTPDGSIVPGGDGHRLTATGHVDADDVDNDDDAGTLHYSFADGTTRLSTDLGAVTIDQNGNYVYTLNDNAANHLAQDDEKSDDFTVIVTDSHGASTEQKVSVTIQGTNDRPELSLSKNELEVTEAGQSIVDGKQVDVGTVKDEGKATGSDVDDHAQLTYAFIDEDGNTVNQINTDYGTLHINTKTGDYWFKLDNNATATQQLKTRGSITLEDFTVRVTDEHGAYAEDTIGVKINGTDDKPTMGGSAVSVQEAGVHNGGNKELVPDNKSNVQKIAVSDPDGDKNFTFAITNTGASKVDDNGIQHLKTDYGTYSLNTKTGEYWFKLDNDSKEVNQLNAGEIVNASKDGQLKLNVSVTDEDGLSSESWFQVQIKGTNDKPTLTLNNAALSVTEDTALTASSVEGSVTVEDPDSGGTRGESFTFGITEQTSLEGHTPAMPTSMEGNYGTLTIDPNTGKYTYTLNNDSPDVQELRTGETRTETFHVVVKDSQGAFDIKEVTVTINGTDDAIRLHSTDAHVIQPTEAGVEFNTNVDNHPQTAGGTFEVTPVDNPVDEDGVNHLVYGFTDADGKFHAGSVEVVQDGKSYGTLRIDAEGTYTFTLADNADVNALNEGELLKLTGYDLAVRDNRHDKDMVTSQKLDLYIHGTNDRPYFTVDGEVSNGITADGLVENGTAVISGKLVADDPDAEHSSKDLSFSIEHDGKLVQVMEGEYGVLELNRDGSYTYTLTHPERLESLNAEQKLSGQDILEQEDFNIRVTDPQNAFTSGKLVIDVTGSADNPVITVSGETSIQEDSGADINHAAHDPTIHGQLGLADIVDAEDSGSVAWSYAGQTVFADGADSKPLGTLTVNSNGSYTYTLSENGSALVQAMNDGQSKYETFKVQAAIDGGKTVTKEITIEIKGTNDKPVLSVGEYGDAFIGKVQQDVFEDDGQTSDTDHPGVIFTGTLPKDAMSDVDDQTGLRYMLVGKDGNPVTEIKTDYGTITLTYETATDGTVTTHYRYTLDNESVTLDKALKALQNGESLTDGAKVVVVDPHGAVSDASHNITVTIDPAVPGEGGGEPGLSLVFDDSSVLHGSVSEDGKDIATTNHVETTTFTGQLEAKWSDESDAPDRVFGIADSFGNQIQSSAADKTVSVEGKYGYLIIDPVTGKYTYTLYNGEDGKAGKVQSLAAGEKVSEDFTLMLNGEVVKNDDSAVKLTIDIYGTNDAPVIKSATDASIGEPGYGGLTSTMTATGTVTATDIDHALDAGGKPTGGTETVTYYFVDKNGNHVTFMQTEYGTIEINGDGMYTFTLDTSNLPKDLVQHYDGGVLHLTAGTHLSETFQVVAYDDKDYSEPQDVTVTINGTNYGPEVVATDVTLTVVEDETLADSGALSDLFHDDEGVGNLSFTASTTENGTGGTGGTVVQGAYGTLQVVNGEYVYTLNNNDPQVQGLDAEHSGKDTFFITAKDEHGGTNTVKITVNVTGKDDAPVLSVDKVLTVREGDSAAFDSGKATAADADSVDQAEGVLRYGLTVPTDDAGNPLHNALLNADGSITNDFGTFKVDKNGSYTFELNNESDDVRALTSGSLTETSVILTVTDSQGNTVSQTVKVDITGTNTAPDVTIELEPNTETPVKENGEDSADSLSGSFTVNDVDGTVASVTATNGNYGKVELTPGEDGQWTYTYTLGEQAEALGAGEKASDRFTVTVTDAEGATTEKTVNVHIEGTNDAPEITTDTTTDRGGTFTFSDVDAGDTHTVTFEGLKDVIGNDIAVTKSGGYDVYQDGECIGTLKVTDFAGGTAGRLQYTFEPNAVYTNNMNHGESVKLDFKLSVDDGHTDGTVGGTTHTFTVESTNAAPSISSPATEGNSGSIAITDSDSDVVTITVWLDTETVTLGTGASQTIGGVTFTYANGKLSYSIGESVTENVLTGESGLLNIVVSADDGHGAPTEQSIALSFTGTNIEPDNVTNTPGDTTPDTPVSNSEDAALPGYDSESHTQSTVENVSDADAKEGTDSGTQPENHGTDANDLSHPTDAMPPADENGVHDQNGPDGDPSYTDPSAQTQPASGPADGSTGGETEEGTSTDSQSHAVDHTIETGIDTHDFMHSTGDSADGPATDTPDSTDGQNTGATPGDGEGTYALFEDYDISIYGPEGSDYDDGAHGNGYYSEGEVLAGIGNDLLGSQETLDVYLPGPSDGSPSDPGVDALDAGTTEGLSLTDGSPLGGADIPGQMPGCIPEDVLNNQPDTGVSPVSGEDMTIVVAMQEQQHGNG